MTPERQSEIIRAACREAGLEGHIKWIERASDAQTQAEKLAYRFKWKDRFPVKNSYMYCDTLDMCFYFAGDNPAVSYSGYFIYGKGDLENGRLIDAFVRANGVLRLMELLAGKEADHA